MTQYERPQVYYNDPRETMGVWPDLSELSWKRYCARTDSIRKQTLRNFIILLLAYPALIIILAAITP